MTVVLFGALTLWLGPWALLFLVVQAIWGFSLLEVVNYIEHYGLLRKKLPSGRYERCAPRHSWNSNHIVTNLALYQLQRHSDHHANPTRRYQALRHFEESPQLPSGYASMLMVAYLPPLWFRLMDKRVATHFGGEIEHANLHPPKREALLRRWGGCCPVGQRPRPKRARCIPTQRWRRRVTNAPTVTSSTTTPWATRTRGLRPARRGQHCRRSGPARNVRSARSPTFAQLWGCHFGLTGRPRQAID